MIKENYKSIRDRIDNACARVGRDPSEVTLIAVSKTKPDEMVEELISFGVRDFGENKPQEIKRRYDQYPVANYAEFSNANGDDKSGEAINWHMIGNLQTNKVKMVVGRASMIHSVNSLHLAEAISKETVKQGVTAKVFIEVNIADEETKHGAASGEDILDIVKSVAALPGVEVHGLMAIAPPVDDPEENRIYFKELRKMRDEIKAENIPDAPMTELSMGMTGDFEVAVEEGATFVRVGTAIFGERDYSKSL